MLEAAVARAEVEGDPVALRRLTAALLEARFWITGAIDLADYEALLTVGAEPGATLDPATEVEVWRVRATIDWTNADVEASTAAITSGARVRAGGRPGVPGR